MRYPFETQTVSKLKSEHTYVLKTTRGSHRDTMPFFYSSHAPSHAPATCGCPKRLDIAGNSQNQSSRFLPRYNTLFGTTFVLGPTPKTNRKWPEWRSQNQPKSNSKIKLPTLGIDRILPNRQLEHEKWVRNHTSFIRIDGQRRENEVGEVRAKIGRLFSIFR
ncbi:hypothetical protein L3X38_012403 [Prunus dulcis]|uniref:Uncharacterized protein n=1 Tax=Prunus dulcis TaxID=3755 RepID=A0AAD4ZGC6_PRUDU|nr:hypothetical protein L3X38_012403 [Prunus dulcis]